MAKKLQYEIGFSINNKEKVKKELDDLQSSLIYIVNSDKNTIKFDVDFKEASKSARELSGLLNSAFDVQTGRFNISKFEQGLKEVGKQAGLTAKEIGNTGKYTTVAQAQLQQYITSLKKAGPEGEQAFLKLASAITKSQAPLVEITKTMDKLWITMKNTVRWQLTSSVLNSMQGAVSSAYGYAKDLDQSLNNIRIVTGKSAEEMKDFAKSANEAAQALNTTTTKYTDAALIYYQQGDTEQQVEEKAQITIDAANAAGTSAEQMSEYLTAVWNSYQAGSEELELFVDKMAAVGAATASSLEEISTAMTKVASTANTVGVNFDQLTSIIATVGSVTRNSPETVGTAFKTIFARIGDLKLGETTEEGLTLGSVSSELEKVGIQILDVNGDLRNLGTVVEEIGEKWQIWNTAQKTAIAQAIAGKRQYTQLIALFDNWDMYQSTLSVSEGAVGTLDQQAAIYAESWKAARDNVKASIEGVYDSLINPDFYIELDKTVGTFLNGLEDVIDGIGGMSGVLTIASTLMFQLFGNKISESIERQKNNLMGLLSKQKEYNEALKTTFLQETNNLTSNKSSSNADIKSREKATSQISEQNTLLGKQVQYLQNISILQGELNKKRSELDPNSYDQLQNQIDIYELYQQQSLELQRQNDLIKEQITSSERIFNRKLPSLDDYDEDIISLVNVDSFGLEYDEYRKNLVEGFQEFGYDRQEALVKSMTTIRREQKKMVDESINSEKRLAILTAARNELNEKYNQETGKFDISKKDYMNLIQIIKQLDVIKNKKDDLYNKEIINPNNLNKVNNLFKLLGEEIDQIDIDLQQSSLKISQIFKEGSKEFNTFYSLIDKANEKGRSDYKVAVSNLNVENEGKSLYTMITQAEKIKKFGDEVVIVGQHFTKTAMAVQGFNSSLYMMGEALGSGEFSFGTLLSVVTGLSMAIPDINENLNGYTNVIKEITEYNKKAENGIVNLNAKQKLQALLFGQVSVAAEGASDQILTFGSGMGSLVSRIATIGNIAFLAVGSIMAIISAIKEYNRQQRQAREEQYNSIAEEIESNRELITSYEQALAQFQETGEGKEKLIELASQVADAYDLEGVAVANLTGNYEELNKQLDEAKKQLQDKELQNLRNQVNVGEENIKAELDTSSFGTYRYYGQYKANNQQQLEALMTSYFGKKFLQGDTSTGLRVAFNENDPEQVRQFIEEGQKVISDLQRIAILTGEQELDFIKDFQSFIGTNNSIITEYSNSKEALASASFQQAFDNAGNFEEVDTYNQYKIIKDQLDAELEKRVQLGEITEEQIDNMMSISMSTLENIKAKDFYMRDLATEKLIERFGSDESDRDLVSQGLSGLDSNTLSLIVEFAPSAASLEDLQSKVQNSLYQSIQAGAEQSLNAIGSVLAEANESYSLTEENYGVLKSDSTFMKAIEEDFENFEEFQSRSIDTQIEYLRDYYTQVYQLNSDSLDFSIDSKQKEILLEQEKLNQLSSLNENQLQYLSDLKQQYLEAETEQERQSLEEQWNNYIEKIPDFEIEYSIKDESIDEIESTIQRLNDELNQLQDKQIEIHTDWSDYDLLKDQFDNLADFASVVQDSNYLVGDSYQYPINEIEQWMKLYPELFAKAQVTSDGLVQINKAEVDNYVQGEKDKVNANAQSQVEKWQLAKEDLEVQKANLEAELAAVRASENGKIEMAGLSAQQQADIILRLTQYYIDKGYETEEAHTIVMKQLGLTTEEFSKVVDSVSKDVSDMLVRSAGEGAKGFVSNFSKIPSGITSTIKTIAEGLKYAWSGGEKGSIPYDTSTTIKTSSTSGYKTDQYGPHPLDPEKSPEQLLKENLEKFDAFEGIDFLEDSYNEAIAEIDKAIANIDAKILAAQNLIKTPASLGGGTPDKGGSKGSGSEKEPNEEELKEMLERYHEITKEIEYQEFLLDKLDKQLERTYGQRRIEAYKKQQEELNKLIELQGEKAKAAQVFMQSDLLQIKNLGMNPTIDQESFNITNYSAILKQITEEYNKEMEKYNALSAEAQEKQKEHIEDVKELYEDRTEVLEKYEESVDTYRQQLETINELTQNLADSKLEEITYELEVVLELKEAKQELNDFIKQIQESIGDALDYTIGSSLISMEDAQINMGLLGNLQDQYNKLIEQLDSEDPNINVDEIKNQLIDLSSEAIFTATSLLDFVESLEEMLPNVINEAREKFDQLMNSFSHNDSIVDTIKEMLVLQGVSIKTAEGFEQLQDIYEQKINSSMSQTDLYKQYYENAKDALEQAQEALDNADKGTQEYDILKANRDALLEEYQSAQQAMYDSAKETMEIAKEMFLDQIERAAREFEEAITDGIGFDLLQDKYDNFIDAEETYFDTVNRIYEVESYRNKLQKDIDESTNKAHQAKLKALQEEMELRTADNKLSQYDVDIMNAKYEMTLKQMALEDAQNAKSQVRLKRNAEGNWSYVYTADQDAIDEANQDYIDAANDYYNIAKEQVKDTSGEIIKTWQEMTEKLKEVYSDEALTTEEREAQIAEIREYYSQKIKDLEQQKAEAIEDMNQAITDSITASGGTQQDIMDAINENYANNLDDMSTSAEDFDDLFNEVCDDMEDAVNDYKDTLEDVAEDVDVAFGSDGLESTLDDVSDSTEELTEKGEDLVSEMWDSLSAIQAQSEAYADLADAIMEVVRAYEKLAGQSIDRVEEEANKNNYYDKNTDYFALISSYLLSGGQVGDDIYSELMRQRYNKIKGEGLDPNDYKEAEEWFENFQSGNIGYEIVQKIYESADRYNKTLEEVLKKLGITESFDTGGYTGTFDNSKLAFLHEKELVLNENDTKNILDAVDFARQITGKIDYDIDSIVSLISDKLDYLTNIYSKINSVDRYATNDIKIYADFPNANSCAEIEAAFQNLYNYASQYANRK